MWLKKVFYLYTVLSASGTHTGGNIIKHEVTCLWPFYCSMFLDKCIMWHLKSHCPVQRCVQKM